MVEELNYGLPRAISPLQKLLGEWVQAFGATVLGIVWEDKP